MLRSLAAAVLDTFVVPLMAVWLVNPFVIPSVAEVARATLNCEPLALAAADVMVVAPVAVRPSVDGVTVQALLQLMIIALVLLFSPSAPGATEPKAAVLFVRSVSFTVQP